MMRVLKNLVAVAGAAVASSAAWAQDAATQTAAAATTAVATAPTPPIPGIGQPNGGMQLQQPMTPIAREAFDMVNQVVNPIMIGISIFVFALLAYAMWRFRARRNPVASTNSHNTVLEVAWTLIPVLILVWIAVPSFRLLANQYDPPKAELTIKATGHQWYWAYEYPDNGGFGFDALPLTKDKADKASLPYLLETDNRLVVPVGTTVKMLVTAADVIHA
ncbi:MAG: cytochrome c oxidase subunit II, partial [Polymorphobacter sp.]